MIKTYFTVILLLVSVFHGLTLTNHHNSFSQLHTTYTHQITEPVKAVLTNTSQPTILPTGWGVTESESYYKSISNLNGQNWIVGDQTIDDYTNKIYDFVTKNNVTKCSDSTPYVKIGEDQCFNCTNDKPLFDLKIQECTSCPTGTTFDPSSHTCKKSECKTGETWDAKLQKCVVPVVPSQDKCTGNRVWNETQKKCVCPEQYPIDIGCQCVTCLQPFVWSSTENTCKLRCPETYEWNKSTQKCECPKATPYEVNGECIACNLPFEWDSTKQTCDFKKDLSCAAQQTTSTNTTAATTQPTTQPTTTTQNTTQPTTTQPTTQPTNQPKTGSCSSNYIYDSNLKQCVCPPSLPFNDGTKCVSCDLPKYWDHDIKQCVYCPQNKYFNTVSRSCEPCISGTTYNQTSKTCQSTNNNTVQPAVISYQTRPTH